MSKDGYSGACRDGSCSLCTAKGCSCPHHDADKEREARREDIRKTADIAERDKQDRIRDHEERKRK